MSMEVNELIGNPPYPNGHKTPAKPWLNIWNRTGASLYHVFNYQMEFFIHRHFMLVGVMFMLAMRLPDWLSTPPHPIGVLIQILIFAPIGGIVAGYILASVSRNIGDKMGGKTAHNAMRAAIAWTNYPVATAWFVFWLSYVIFHQFQPADVQKTIWLFEGTTGWIPVAIAAPVMAWAILIRLRAVAYTLRKTMFQAAFIWVATVLLVSIPAVVIGGAYYTIFRTTVSVAQQAGG
jgi:hypothetical protein